MSDEERILTYSRPMEKNPNWKGGKSYNYCSCGKRISWNAKNCKKCRPLTGKDNPFYNKHHTVETKNELSKVPDGFVRLLPYGLSGNVTAAGEV